MTCARCDATRSSTTQTYDDSREAYRAARSWRSRRRGAIHVGQHLTFLFENTDTIRYQVQEMMRAERIVREADIQHELDTYNELLGGAGELGCCLLIEIDDRAEREKPCASGAAFPPTCTSAATTTAWCAPRMTGPRWTRRRSRRCST